ncbi:MAG: dockerin type I repeat-containing protein [Lachnospiraceae bacterium]
MKKTIYLIITFVLLCGFSVTAKAAEYYGSVSKEGTTLTVTLENSRLANKMVSLVVYDSEGDINNIDASRIGYIDQDTANAKGELTFSNIVLTPPASSSITYDIYIGYEGSTDKIKLASTTVTSTDGNGLKGDMNDSGKVTAVDALLAMKTGASPTQDELNRGDINGDGQINTTDVEFILQYATGEIASFPN